jgi:hypothetical protein
VVVKYIQQWLWFCKKRRYFEKNNKKAFHKNTIFHTEKQKHRRMTDMKGMSRPVAEEYSTAALLGKMSFQLRLCTHGVI